MRCVRIRNANTREILFDNVSMKESLKGMTRGWISRKNRRLNNRQAWDAKRGWRTRKGDDSISRGGGKTIYTIQFDGSQDIPWCKWKTKG